MGDLCLIGCLIPVLPAGGDDLVGHQLDLLLVARVVWHALQVERVLQARAQDLYMIGFPVALADLAISPDFGDLPPIGLILVGFRWSLHDFRGLGNFCSGASVLRLLGLDLRLLVLALLHGDSPTSLELTPSRSIIISVGCFTS